MPQALEDLCAASRGRQREPAQSQSDESLKDKHPAVHSRVRDAASMPLPRSQLPTLARRLSVEVRRLLHGRPAL